MVKKNQQINDLLNLAQPSLHRNDYVQADLHSSKEGNIENLFTCFSREYFIKPSNKLFNNKQQQRIN